ncbi:MAG: hypothetical protein PW786_13500 [Arachidicoccus sp.]|nr:hypothetical protein [Arachidicoccus sp.]
MENYEGRRITVKAAIELLKQDGYIVTEEQAKIILDFMYEMAEIAVEQYLSEPDEINADDNNSCQK